MAKIVRSETTVEATHGGSEDSLQSWGTFFLVFGIISAGALLIFSAQSGITVIDVSLAAYFLISGLFMKALMTGASDIIRLLKKSTDTPFSGQIEGLYRAKTAIFSCDKCGREVSKSDRVCPGCSEELDPGASFRDECLSCGARISVHPWNVSTLELKCPSCSRDLDIYHYIANHTQTCPHCSTSGIAIGHEERIAWQYTCTSCNKIVNL